MVGAKEAAARGMVGGVGVEMVGGGEAVETVEGVREVVV